MGGSDTLAGGISGGYASGSLGKSGYKSSTHLLSIYHEAGYKVQVTTTVSTEKGTAPGQQADSGCRTESGGCESALYAATFAFDLSSAADQQAFEKFCRLPLPFADGRNDSLGSSTTARRSQQIHARRRRQHLRRFNIAREDRRRPGRARQLHRQADRGPQPRFDPWPVRDEKHASAEIVSSLLIGKEEGFAREDEGLRRIRRFQPSSVWQDF